MSDQEDHEIQSQDGEQKGGTNTKGTTENDSMKTDSKNRRNSNEKKTDTDGQKDTQTETKKGRKDSQTETKKEHKDSDTEQKKERKDSQTDTDDQKNSQRTESDSPMDPRQTGGKEGESSGGLPSGKTMEDDGDSRDTLVSSTVDEMMGDSGDVKVEEHDGHVNNGHGESETQNDDTVRDSGAEIQKHNEEMAEDKEDKPKNTCEMDVAMDDEESSRRNQENILQAVSEHGISSSDPNDTGQTTTLEESDERDRENVDTANSGKSDDNDNESENNDRRDNGDETNIATKNTTPEHEPNEDVSQQNMKSDDESQEKDSDRKSSLENDRTLYRISVEKSNDEGHILHERSRTNSPNESEGNSQLENQMSQENVKNYDQKVQGSAQTGDQIITENEETRSNDGDNLEHRRDSSQSNKSLRSLLGQNDTQNNRKDSNASECRNVPTNGENDKEDSSDKTDALNTNDVNERRLSDEDKNANERKSPDNQVENDTTYKENVDESHDRNNTEEKDINNEQTSKDNESFSVEDMSSVSDSITNDRDEELEQLGLNSENDETSLSGQPPISTVYVKPHRKESDSESKTSDTQTKETENEPQISEPQTNDPENESQISETHTKEAEVESESQKPQSQDADAESEHQVGECESERQVDESESDSKMAENETNMQDVEPRESQRRNSETVSESASAQDEIDIVSQVNKEVEGDRIDQDIEDRADSEVQSQSDTNKGVDVEVSGQNGEDIEDSKSQIEVKEDNQSQIEDKQNSEYGNEEKRVEGQDEEGDRRSDKENTLEGGRDDDGRVDEIIEDKLDSNVKDTANTIEDSKEDHVEVKSKNEIVAEEEEQEEERSEVKDDIPSKKSSIGNIKEDESVSDKELLGLDNERGETQQAAEEEEESGGTRKTATDGSKVSLVSETSLTKQDAGVQEKDIDPSKEDTQSIDSRQSRGQDAYSLKSVPTVEEDEQPAVDQKSEDAAQAPADDNTDGRGSVCDEYNEPERYKIGSRVSIKSTSDIRSITSKRSSKARTGSQISVRQQNQEATPVVDQSASNDKRQDQDEEPRQSRSSNSRRQRPYSPQRSSGSPYRRSPVRAEAKSARRSPRTQTRSPSRPRTTNTLRSSKSKESEGRSRQKELFREELRKIEDSLKRERSSIKRPEVKKHSPYIFNTLEPYYNVSTVRYLLELPEEVRHSYVSRKTAIGLCDPWVDHDMDTQFLPRLSASSSRSVNRQQEMERRDQKVGEREQRAKKEGSTMLPKFPVVTMDSKDLQDKQLNFSDVPMLRKELRNKYSQNATKKVDQDYTRTKNDFYRMDLDKLDEVHPINRGNMRNAYFAYLQNTPGSKKAVYECVKTIKSETKAQ